MAPKSVGGAGDRTALAHVEGLRAAGLSEDELRQRLCADGYRPPRISQLLKSTRPAAAPADVPSSEKSKDNKKKPDKSQSKKEERRTSTSGKAKQARKSKADDTKKKDKEDKKNRKKSRDSEKSSDTDKPQTQVPGKAPVPEADKITAAFTVWSQGEVQLLAAAVAEEKTRVGSLPTGVVPWPLLQGFIDRVPTAVRDCFPALATWQAEVGDASQVSNVFAKKVLARLAVITSEAEALFEEQSGAAAGSTAE